VFKTSVDFQWTTQPYIPEDRTLHNHCYENLKSYIIKIFIYLSHLMNFINIVNNSHMKVGTLLQGINMNCACLKSGSKGKGM
jgi:hypothetical protein